MYGKSISDITIADLQGLVDDRAAENVRLEFKREMPQKDELLKKLSSFANTFGGYLIIGAKANSKDGIIESLTGIERESGLKQKIIQWCFDGVSPPLAPEVSDPISLNSEPDKVCYIIFVSESDEAPHFVNGRKGVWIRTDEFSQRFEAKLADSRELEALWNRRSLIIERKRHLIDRARTRFENYALNLRKSGIQESISADARFYIAVAPRFPTRTIIKPNDLPDILKDSIINWRRSGFPFIKSGIITQHESAIILDPCGSCVTSMLELNVWGALFYGAGLLYNVDNTRSLHFSAFLGHLTVFAHHASKVIKPADGSRSYDIQINFRGMLGLPWLMPSQGSSPRLRQAAPVDDDFTITYEAQGAKIQQSPDRVVDDILELILFSLNLKEIALDASQRSDMLWEAYNYNNWPYPYT